MEKHKCSASVREAGAWRTLHKCRRAGKIERDGKWFCKTHDPVEVARRESEWAEKWESKWESEKQAKLRSASRNAILAEREKVIELIRIGYSDESWGDQIKAATATLLSLTDQLRALDKPAQ